MVIVSLVTVLLFGSFSEDNLHFDLKPVPVILQTGQVTNCGPTSAAMLLAFFLAPEDPDTALRFRDEIGAWTWEQFPMRQAWKGNSTASMIVSGLNYLWPIESQNETEGFGTDTPLWLPGELGALFTLGRHQLQGLPFLVLVKASVLWDQETEGNHWILVRSVKDGLVVYNDPAFGRVLSIPLEQFWEAWQALGWVSVVKL